MMVIRAVLPGTDCCHRGHVHTSADIASLYVDTFLGKEDLEFPSALSSFCRVRTRWFSVVRAGPCAERTLSVVMAKSQFWSYRTKWLSRIFMDSNFSKILMFRCLFPEVSVLGPWVETLDGKALL